MNERDSIAAIKGVGEKTEKLLEKLEIRTCGDLLYTLPRAYKDLSNQKLLAEARLEEPAFFCVQVCGTPKTKYIRAGLEITSFTVQDESGIALVDIFNQKGVKHYLNEGKALYLYGKLSLRGRKLSLSAPEIYFAKPQTPFLPIYPLTAGLKQTMMRKWMQECLQAVQVPECYSGAFLQQYTLPTLQHALQQVHFPKDAEASAKARARIVFDELMVFNRMLELLGEEESAPNARPYKISAKSVDAFARLMPFALTGAQKRVAGEIAADLKSKRYMNRMVQGDVGSGKTVLAFFAMYCAALNGCQSVLMAPTEVLAKQHYAAACEWFGAEKVVLLTGSASAKARKQNAQRIEEGSAAYVIGTHAVIYAGVAFHNLGLLVTDEQHRFGVKQRAELAGSHDVHTLIMSATPIPRSLALVLYGKTDISIVDELPPGRSPIKTYLIREHKFADMLGFIRQELAQGRQAYVVCPLIEENEEFDAKSVEELHVQMQQEFQGFAVAVLHGRMKASEKERIMSAFYGGSIAVLVSTTVIEVGVNVPNATVMVVQNAERFGLAQLHQLRGRVGRGKHQSYCFLVSDNQNAFERLRILVSTNDGFVIAEEDMKLRGSGDVFGVRQHGMGSLRHANLISDSRLLVKTREVLERMRSDRRFAQEYEAITRKAKQQLEQKMIEIALN